MNNGLTFINQDFLGVVIFSALMLWVIFVWKEWKNRKKKRFFISVLVALITIASLVLIALKPAYENNISTGQTVILTKAFQENLLDSLKSIYKEIKVLEYDSNSNIQNALDSVTSAFILGHGLEIYDFWQFDGIPTTYLPSKLTRGINKLSYKNSAYLGSEMTIFGEYKNPRKGNQLVFSDAGGNVLDSIILKTDSIQKFNLKSELKVTGNLIYNLIEKDSLNNIIVREPLPIMVSEKNPLRILILNTYPTFETKYLKNFLASRGHELIIRSQLTQNRFKFEYYNTDKSPIYRLTEDILANLDLLIIDKESYSNLATSTKKVLHNTIENKGLGVFIQPNDAYFKLPQNKSFFKFKSDNKNEMIVENKSNTTLQKYPFDFELSINELAIYICPEIKIGARKYIGIGKVASTNLLNTYQLVLNGKQDIYNSFWTVVLDEVSKKAEVNSEWQAKSVFPRINEPYVFSLHTSELKPVVTNKSGSRIPLLQDAIVSTRWKGVEYPRKIGWNQLKIESDTTSCFNYFIFDSLQYASIRDVSKIDANLRQFESQEIKDRKGTRLTAISLFWFYGLFLLGIGYLWLEPKI